MFEAGALVLLPFPYSDATTTKRRPVLALTVPDEYGDFIGMAITSRFPHANAMPLQNEFLVEGQFPKPSWVRIDRVVTLNIGLVVTVFAVIKTDIHRQVVGRLCEMLHQQIRQA